MDKYILIDKIKSVGSIGQSDKDKILAWVNSLPNSSTKIMPNEIKICDVLMHPIFGHPYILFDKQNDHWICGLLTSEAGCDEIIEACDSRFFNSSFFTKTLFTVKEPLGVFMAPYENKTHMLKVYKNIKQIFS